MIFYTGGQLASRKLGDRYSIAARGFFDVLWRWSRVGCEASQTRRYGADVLHSGFQAQRTCFHQAKPRSPIPLLSSTARQRRSHSFSSMSRSPNTESSPAEGKGSIGELPLPSSDALLEGPTSSTFTAGTVDVQSLSSEGLEPPEDERTQRHSLLPEKVATEMEVVGDQPLPPLSRELRGIMRTLPSSVVVLTATSSTFRPIPSRNSSEHYPPKPRTKLSRGMTLSSYASVALSPDPVITFNIRCPSSTLDAFCRNRQILIHILDASQQGANIANLFTKANGEANCSTLGREFEIGRAEKLFGMERHLVTSRDGDGGKFLVLPRLKGEGIGKVLRCELIEGSKSGESSKVKDTVSYGQRKPPSGLIAVGDHVLVLARVVEILEIDGAKSDGKEDMTYGLMYADGKYRSIGQPILPITQNEKK